MEGGWRFSAPGAVKPHDEVVPIVRQDMPEKPPTPLTEALPQQPTPADDTTRPERHSPRFRFDYLGHFLMVAWAIAAAALTASNPASVQGLERQAQGLLFKVRGPVPPPSEIVILAIDEGSLAQLSNLPLRRAIYAEAIDKVMQAGAKAVVVDVLWDLPSSYGSGLYENWVSEDDQQLQAVLQRHEGQIALPANFVQGDSRQGEQSNFILPYAPFQSDRTPIGHIKFLSEPNGRVHLLGSRFASRLPAQEAEIFRSSKVPSLAEAALQATKIKYSPPQGDNIFFYGGAGTFKLVSFGNVISPENWNSGYLQKEKYFKDKIVLIGVIAKASPDFVLTPMGEMSGVELHANAIATLLHDRSIREAFADPAMAGGLVLLVTFIAGLWQSLARRPLFRLFWAGVIGLGWASTCYVAFGSGLVILPMAVPIGAIGLVGVSYWLTGSATGHLLNQRNRRISETVKRSARTIEMMTQRSDREDLLQERELELANKTLGGRYKITQILGHGGFGETYIAQDIKRPQSPQCVVKQLSPATNNPSHLKLARRLFDREAETLERLGKHDQIPRLLAYFEEDGEFYLVQEYIPGHALSAELSLGRQLPEARVVDMLRELLEILSFVHGEQVIHRDIKPSNIIRRQTDGKLVLIDFGAVKDQYSKLAAEDTSNNLTIGIGTQGYMAPEQAAGKPQHNSDIYAVGMMGIQALAGLPPSQLKPDSQTGEIRWEEKALVSRGLANVLSKMVRYDSMKRYQSAIETLQALKKLSNFTSLQLSQELFIAPEMAEEIALETRPWVEMLGLEGVPPNEPPNQ